MSFHAKVRQWAVFCAQNCFPPPSEMQLSLGPGLHQDSRLESDSLLPCGVRTGTEGISSHCLNRRRRLAWQSKDQKWDLLINHIMNTKIPVPGTLPGPLSSLNSCTQEPGGLRCHGVQPCRDSPPSQLLGCF